MARSKKNGVAPSSEEKKKGRKPTGGSIAVVEAGGGKGSAGKLGGKDSSASKNKRKTIKDQAVGDAEEDEGSMAGTAGRASRNTRDAVREEVMTQVLKDYHAKPIVQAAVPQRQLVWPFFRLRRLLGWAHVGLHDAVLDGNIAIVKATLLRYMRKSPAKINEHDEEGRTALSLALLEQREDIADLIISIDDTDINAPDAITGLSPLHNAVLLDLGSSAQKLAFRGANVNGVDKVGMTPLMLACRLGHESMVDMLVRVFGAEIDPADKVQSVIVDRDEFKVLRWKPYMYVPCKLPPDEAGWTCLFYATYHNEANIVQYLLMHGADPDQKDNRGMTAVDWGEHMEFGETCAIFSSFESQLAS